MQRAFCGNWRRRMGVGYLLDEWKEGWVWERGDWVGWKVLGKYVGKLAKGERTGRPFGGRRGR
jgi:hypothetical protein